MFAESCGFLESFLEKLTCASRHSSHALVNISNHVIPKMANRQAGGLAGVLLFCSGGRGALVALVFSKIQEEP
jgi:hypothetical protein